MLSCDLRTAVFSYFSDLLVHLSYGCHNNKTAPRDFVKMGGVKLSIEQLKGALHHFVMA